MFELDVSCIKSRDSRVLDIAIDYSNIISTVTRLRFNLSGIGIEKYQLKILFRPVSCWYRICRLHQCRGERSPPTQCLGDKSKNLIPVGLCCRTH